MAASSSARERTGILECGEFGDLGDSPSLSTRRVLVLTVALSRLHPDRLPPRPELGLFLRRIGGIELLATAAIETPGWIGRVTARAALRRGDKKFSGLGHHLLLRKLWFHDRVSRFIANGHSQIIMLGAGFDALPWRLLADNPDLRIVDIDRPQVLNVKRSTITNPPPGWLPIAMDLWRRDPSTVLAKIRDLAPDKQTLIVAEAILMYLPQNRAAEVLHDLRGRFRRADVVFSYLVPPPPSNNPAATTGFDRLQRTLARAKEPFLWTSPPDRIATWLGGPVTENSGDAKLHRELLPSATPFAGPAFPEQMVIAPAS